METVIHKLCRGALGAAIALAVFIAVGAVYVWEAHGAAIAAADSVSAPAVWPIAARAQQSARIPRIGLLMGYAESDPTAQPFVAAFVQGLQQLGWTDGRNIRIVYRWAVADVNQIQKFAKELVEIQPDVILANSTPVTAALHQKTGSIPIVFATVSDPVGAGFVTSLAQPGGNITGYNNIEASLGGKWLELLKEMAPGVRRAAIMFNPDTAPGEGSYFLNSFEVAARSLGVEPITAAVRSDADIERAITALGRESGGGLVVSADVFMFVHRASIISLATRNRVPAIFPNPVATTDGGLLAYGADNPDVFRYAATYVDRVLRGAKPRDLPVQVPTIFRLIINLKTVETLGLTVPLTLQARADEVIE